MIRWEAVIIAMLGTSLGLVIGLFFGWAVVEALKDQGFTEFSPPVGQLHHHRDHRRRSPASLAAHLPGAPRREARRAGAIATE